MRIFVALCLLLGALVRAHAKDINCDGLTDAVSRAQKLTIDMAPPPFTSKSRSLITAMHIQNKEPLINASKKLINTFESVKCKDSEEESIRKRIIGKLRMAIADIVFETDMAENLGLLAVSNLDAKKEQLHRKSENIVSMYIGGLRKAVPFRITSYVSNGRPIIVEFISIDRGMIILKTKNVWYGSESPAEIIENLKATMKNEMIINVCTNSNYIMMLYRGVFIRHIISNDDGSETNLLDIKAIDCGLKPG